MLLVRYFKGQACENSETGACYHCQLNGRNCTGLPIPPSRVDRCDNCYGKMDKKSGCCMTRPQSGMCMMAGAACTWVVSDMSIARRTEIDRIREALERNLWFERGGYPAPTCALEQETQASCRDPVTRRPIGHHDYGTSFGRHRYREQKAETRIFEHGRIRRGHHTSANGHC